MYSKTLAVIALVLTKITFDAAYVFLLVPRYEYAGFLIDVGLTREALSIAAVASLGFLAPTQRSKRPSDYVLMMLVTAVVLPASTLFGLAGKPGQFFLALYLCILLVWAIARLPIISFPTPRFGLLLWQPVCILGVLFLLAAFTIKGGWTLFNLNIYHIYDVRAQAAQTLTAGYLGYLTIWTTKVFSIFLVLHFASKNRWLCAAAIFSLQVCFFAMTGHKTILAFPIAALVVMILYRSQFSPIGIIMLALGGTLVAIVAVLALDMRLPFHWIFMRIFMLTALNHYEYYEFALTNGWTYYSNSILSGIVEYPFDRKVPLIIGQGRWREGAESFANTGVFASGYMHLGYLGMGIHAVIMGLVLWAANCLLRHSSMPSVGFALFFMGTFQFRDIDLPVALWSGGVLIMLIGLWLLSGQQRRLSLTGNFRATLPRVSSNKLGKVAPHRFT